MTVRPGTALVTGASSGIGAAFARLLAQRGHDLVLVARRKDRLDEIAVDLERVGVTVEVLPADLTSAEGLRAVEARLADDARPVEVLVNNAGFGTAGKFAKLDVDREADMVRLNVLAVVRLTHAALGGMLARGHGGILNVSSTAGFQPIAEWATYSATKAFVSRFTEAVAEENRGYGVHITALCPGFTRTEFHEKADFEAGKLPGVFWQDQEEVARRGLAALESGRVYAIPGVAYRALAATTGLVPRVVVRRLAYALFRRL